MSRAMGPVINSVAAKTGEPGRAQPIGENQFMRIRMTMGFFAITVVILIT
jgi:hypothetical protein